MALKINWIPFEPQSGGDLQWEVEMAFAADSSQPALVRESASNQTKRFSSKITAQAFVNGLCDAHPDADGTITVRLVRS